jgi:hypothetical protein
VKHITQQLMLFGFMLQAKVKSAEGFGLTSVTQEDLKTIAFMFRLQVCAQEYINKCKIFSLGR